MISIKVTGVPQAIEVAKAAQQLLLQYTLGDLDWFGQAVVEKMKEHHPPGGPHPPAGAMPVYGKHRYIDRTGQLTGGLGYRVTPWTPRTALVAVFAVAPYSDLVEHGHPGARPYPFFWPSFYMYLPLLMIRLQASADRAFADAAAQYGLTAQRVA